MTRLCVGLADKSSGHYDWRVRCHGAGGYRSIMNGHSSKPEWAAFTRVEVLIIALTIGVLAGCLTPSEKRGALSIACNNNLKCVGLAFKTWSIDQSDEYPMRRPKEQGGTKELIGTGQVFVHFRVLSNELSTPKVLVCPADKAKVFAENFDSGFSDVNASYFLGLDASEESPMALLSGNRNLATAGHSLNRGLFTLTTNTPLSWAIAIHDSCGNVCFADGSVQFLGSAKLAEAVRNQGVATNRLAVP